MSDDIVDRLRALDWWRGEYGSKEILCREAADEIERLRAVLRDAEIALAAFKSVEVAE